MIIYRNLFICSLNQEQHERTCNYWYTVTSNATAHTAFTTRAALLRWLEDRNLTTTDPIPEVGTWGAVKITGEYAIKYHMEAAEFDALAPVVERRKVDNGQYTLARITDNNGYRTVHLMNCNAPRITFDYAESRKLEDA
jgi:hypothetical protein